MAQNLLVGPLTTIYTPPASCLGVITSAGPPFSPSYSLFVGHFGSYETPALNCYPEGAATIIFTTNYYWSPGICPKGYSTACAFTGLAPFVAASLCCPLGFDCAYANWPHVCSSVATTPLTNVWELTSDTGTLPAGYSFLTVKPNPSVPTLTVWNDGIPVAWEATDMEILALLGSTTTSPVKAAPTTTPIPTTIPPPVSPTVSIPSSTTSTSATTPLVPTTSSSSHESASPLDSTPSSSSRESPNPTGTTSSSSSAPGNSGSSPTSNGPSSRSIPTSPANPPPSNSTGLGSDTPAASVSGTGFFSGHRGKVRIALIVAIPIIGLAALIGIFFCVRRFDLSIRRRDPTSSAAKLRTARGAEADSRPRYEMGSGETQMAHFPSELAGNAPFSKEL